MPESIDILLSVHVLDNLCRRCLDDFGVQEYEAQTLQKLRVIVSVAHTLVHDALEVDVLVVA